MVPKTKLKISVDPQAVLIAALALMFLPLPWVSAWFLAGAVHEICHCLAVMACGSKIERMQIGLNGACMYTNLESPLKESVCLLAGPVGAGMLMLFSSQFPRLAICAMLQTAYNLLPLSNLDGGQVLARITGFLFSPVRSGLICMIIERFVLTCVVLLCVIGCVWFKLGLFPIFIAGILLMKNGKIKTSCKWGNHRVQ